MKKSFKLLSIFISIIMVVTTSAIAANAIAVEKDGKTYFLRSHAPTTGDCKVLVIRLGFADYSVDDEDYPALSEETLLSYFDGSEDSVNGYYKTSSYGKLRLSCDKVYTYTAEHNRSEYSEYNEDNLTLEALLQEALDAFENDINYDDYDSDGDGYLDYVCFNFAGPKSGWGGMWWPHVDTAKSITAGGKQIDCYSVLTGEVTTFIHEFGHIIGAADYYAKSGNKDNAIRTYDMMSINIGDHNGFTKWSYGWINEDEITFVDKSMGETEVKLVPIETTESGKKIAVVAPTPVDSFLDEYFLVEYDSGERNSADVFDRYGIEPGFRIFHVNAKANYVEDINTVDFSQGNGTLKGELIHNVKNEYADPNIWMKDSSQMLYRDGDTLGVDGYPNTGLSSDSAIDGVFTGITFFDFVTGDKPSFKVSFTDDCEGGSAPELSLSYEKLASDMKMTLSSDKPLYLTNFKTQEEYFAHQPYLLDKDGNKLTMSAQVSDDSSAALDFSYRGNDSPIQPNTEYTFVIPEGYFTTTYSEIVPEFRQNVKTESFLTFTNISTLYGADAKLYSNIFAVTDKTYGVVTAPFSNGSSSFTFTEYNFNGEVISSSEFALPELGEDTGFFKAIVTKLGDDNFALEMCANDENCYFVKLDKNGKALSRVFALSASEIQQYTGDSLYEMQLDVLGNGLQRQIIADDYSSAAMLRIDFEKGSTFVPADPFDKYYPIDSEAYALRRYSGGGYHLFVYDSSDEQIADIQFDGPILCVFAENGNINVIRCDYDDDNAAIVFVYTYSNTGELLSSKEITENASHIDEHGVFENCYASEYGYFLTHTDETKKTVLAYDRDWNYIGDLEIESYKSSCIIGNIGLVKYSNFTPEYGPCEIVSRFNIGEVEIVHPTDPSEPETTEPETTEPTTEPSTTPEKTTKPVTEPETTQSASVPTPDNASAKSATNDSAVTPTNGGAVQTGESSIAVIVLLVLMACAAAMYFTKIKD